MRRNNTNLIIRLDGRTISLGSIKTWAELIECIDRIIIVPYPTMIKAYHDTKRLPRYHKQKLSDLLELGQPATIDVTFEPTTFYQCPECFETIYNEKHYCLQDLTRLATFMVRTERCLERGCTDRIMKGHQRLHICSNAAARCQKCQLNVNYYDRDIHSCFDTRKDIKHSHFISIVATCPTVDCKQISLRKPYRRTCTSCYLYRIGTIAIAKLMAKHKTPWDCLGIILAFQTKNR